MANIFKRHHNGRFASTMERSPILSLADLPKSNFEAIKFLQSYAVLPKSINNVDLLIKKNKCNGSSINEFLTLLIPGQHEYISVIPQVFHHSKLELVTLIKILYFFCIEMKHVQIAKLLGWAYIDECGNLSKRDKTITRMRSNYFICFVGSLYL